MDIIDLGKVRALRGDPDHVNHPHNDPTAVISVTMTRAEWELIVGVLIDTIDAGMTRDEEAAGNSLVAQIQEGGRKAYEEKDKC